MSQSSHTAFITGASSGIGAIYAERLAARGYDLILAARREDRLQALAGQLQARYAIRASILKADLSEEQGIEAVEQRLQQDPAVDLFINNAGTAITRKAIDLSEEEWDRVVDLDLKSVFFCAQSAARVMIPQQSGKIINVASILGLVGANGLIPYCAAKGGVVNLSRALASEWARYGIQVNSLCPGYVITDINREKLSDEKTQAALLAKTPAGRLGQVGDMTGAALFLASPASDYMTGQSLTVDGGWTAI